MELKSNESHWIWHVTDEERDQLRFDLLLSHKKFCRAFIQELEGVDLVALEYVDLLCKLADDILLDQRKRSMCWIPPGYGKTLILTIMAIARGFAINPNARILHISYSDDLVLDNSLKVKDILECELFQVLWPMTIRPDAKKKGLWKLSEGGELKAVSTAGQITGFRAGRLGEGYTGHIAIDDPIKPDDVYSPAKRARINGLFKSTVPSRLMHVNIPVLLVMQRLHSEDTASFFAKGGFRGFTWDVLSIPAINEGYAPEMPHAYTHVKTIPYTISEGALWPEKESEQDLDQIRNAELDGDSETLIKQGEYYFAAQYMQQPSNIKNNMIKADWFGWYDEIPALLSNNVIIVDTAMKDGVDNDYTVFMLCGVARHEDRRKLYVIDIWRGKWKLPQLIKNLNAYWSKYKYFRTEKLRRRGATKVLIEDKGHGTALIQTCRNEQDVKKRIPVMEVQRSISKLQRAIPCLPIIEAGDVMLPEEATELSNGDWVPDFIEEITAFNELMTHTHDDQCDVLFDGIEKLLLGSISIWQAMGAKR